MSVGEWLASLQLPHYIDLFLCKGYSSIQACQDLTEKDLDKLGIQLQGHRRRILAHLPVTALHSLDLDLPVTDDYKMAARTSAHEEDVYDIPPARKSVAKSDDETDEMYINVAHLRRSSSLAEVAPALPPKRSSKRESFIEAGSSTPTTPIGPHNPRPVPAPRTNKKKGPEEMSKPRPTPRARVKKPRCGDDTPSKDTDSDCSFTFIGLDDEIPSHPEMPKEVTQDDGYILPDQSNPTSLPTNSSPTDFDNHNIKNIAIEQDMPKPDINANHDIPETGVLLSGNVDIPESQPSQVQLDEQQADILSTSERELVPPSVEGYINMNRGSHPSPPTTDTSTADLSNDTDNADSKRDQFKSHSYFNTSNESHVSHPSAPQTIPQDNILDLDFSVFEDNGRKSLDSVISTSDEENPQDYQQIWRMKTGMPMRQAETVYYDAVAVQEDLYDQMPSTSHPAPPAGPVVTTDSMIITGGSVRQTRPPRVSEELDNGYRESFYMPAPQFPPPPLPSVVPPALPPRPHPGLSGTASDPTRASIMSFSDLATERSDSDQTTPKEVDGATGGSPRTLSPYEKPPAPHSSETRPGNLYVQDPITPTRRAPAPPVPHHSRGASAGNIYLPEPTGSQGTPPPPPPRGPKPFMELFDPKRGTYSVDEDSIPSFTENSSVWESDDTLSDGGDFVDPLALRRPSNSDSSIPIVPAKEESPQSKNASETCSLIPNTQGTRKGFLYKCASLKSHRKGWKKYWIDFDAKKLSYFSSQKSSLSKRIIPAVTMVNVEQDIRSGDSHPYRFKVTTIDRVYSFATDAVDDLTLWTSILMRAILDNKEEQAALKEGGDMYRPDRSGFINLEGVKGNRFVAIKKDKLAYYNTFNDFKAASPIHEIDMKLASVKELGKTSLQLTTPNAALVFNFESSEEQNVWKDAMESAIAEGLADDRVLNEVFENHSNRLCADCGSTDPHWASINLGITLCKHCAGIHRMLNTPASKVRSLRMDSRVWTPSLVLLMKTIGNDNSNNFWEWNTTEEDRIDSDVDMFHRKEYILAKYQEGRFCRLHPLSDDQNALNEALCKSVQYGDVLETMQLLFSGADILWKTASFSGSSENVMQLAQKAKQKLQMEFLYQNGAEGIHRNPTRVSIRSRSGSVDNLRPAITPIFHKGHLWKSGTNQKEFCRRWFVLENGCLSYFESDKASVAKDSIDRKEMMSIAVTTDEKQEFSFELGTSKYHGRVYSMAAESLEDRSLWVTRIAKCFAPLPPSCMAQIQDIKRAGVVFLRDGATTDWHTTWMQLKSRHLFIFKKDSQTFEEIDLRKILAIKSLQQTDLCPDAFDDGPPFVIDLPNRGLYIQGDIRRETEAWLAALQNAVNESGGKLTDQQLTADNIPVIVEKCISFVATFGLKQQGIYRINGQHSKVTSLIELFKTNARVVSLDNKEYQINDVATALKRFLRTMDEPLLTSHLYPKWIETANIQEHDTKMQWYKYLLGELPPVHYHTLKRIIMHLSRIAEYENENKMTAMNLASIFGPILLNVDKEGEMNMTGGYRATNQEIAVLHDIITYNQWLFDVKDMDLEYERKIQEALEKIEAAKQTSVNQADELLLGVYVKSVDGECINVKVTKDMTGEDVLELVKARGELDPDRNWGLYEVICDTQLERPIHYQEPVLDAMLRWSNWPQDFCKNNCLCVKEDYILENIKHISDSHFSLYTELKYSEKKGFKKYCFEFNQMKLSFHKDARTLTPISSWNVEDLTFYINTEAKRTPPTKFCCTFIVKNEKIVKNKDTPYFGHALSFASMEEMYRWLAAMLNSQHHKTGLTSRDRRPQIAFNYPDVTLSQQGAAAARDSVLSNQSASRSMNSSFFKRLIKRQTYNVN